MSRNEQLTKQQEIFCKEYLKDLNARRAAERAGYSKHTAQVQGSRLMQNEKVQKRVQALFDKRAAKIELSAELILERLLEVATVDLADAYDSDGKLKPLHDIPKSVRQAMSGIDVAEEFAGYGKDRQKVADVRKVKFWDKIKALEVLGKHLKLFTDKVEHSGKVTLEDMVAGSHDAESEEN